MMVIADLADAIRQALGQPLPVTGEMTAYAKAVIDTLKGGKFSHASGSVTGTAAPSGPLMNGAAAGGILSSLLTATWVGDLTAGFPTAPPANLSLEANASIGYLLANAIVTFAPNAITGTCTATPSSPGILQNGAGTGGTISGLVGSAWAAAVLSALGIASGPLAAPVYNAVAGYIMANAECSYASGSVTGTFGAGGGALVAGTGVNGIIA